MAKALIAALVASIIAAPVAIADESDELNRALNVAYCLPRQEFGRDQTCHAAPQYGDAAQFCSENQRVNDRMSAYLAGTYSMHPSWSAQIALGIASGRSDLNSCIEQAAGPGTPAICRRLKDRCAEIDRILPY